jgi:hypothetical protein
MDRKQEIEKIEKQPFYGLYRELLLLKEFRADPKAAYATADFVWQRGYRLVPDKVPELEVLTLIKDYCQEEIDHMKYMQGVIKDDPIKTGVEQALRTYDIEINTLKRVLNKLEYLNSTYPQAQADKKTLEG